MPKATVGTTLWDKAGGYSELALYRKRDLKTTKTSFAMEGLDHEGGIQRARQESFISLNMYFPHEKDKKLIISRHPNEACKKIDLTRPK